MHTDIRKKLNIDIESPYWDEALEQAKAMPAVPQWLTKEFLCDLEDDFAILGKLKTPVLRAAEQVAQSPDFCLLLKVLFCIIGYKAGYSKSFTALEFPAAPEGADSVAYDFMAIFPILAHVRLFADALAARGVTKDIISDSFFFLKYRINDIAEKMEKPCYGQKSFASYGLHIYTNFLCIGRLRFEIHTGFDRNVKAFSDGKGNVRILMCDVRLHAKGNILGAVGYTEEDGAYDADFVETDSYYEGYAVDPATGLAEPARTRLSKKEWKRILQTGDAVLKVHIPGMGKLLKADCDAAYARAVEVYRSCFPEYDFKGFVCNTWLLCPVMGRFLKKDSNIMQFQEKYHVFPAKNNAPDVFHYVFSLEVASAADVDPETLTENNSMQRGIKALLKEGTFVHQFNGFIPF